MTIANKQYTIFQISKLHTHIFTKQTNSTSEKQGFKKGHTHT